MTDERKTILDQLAQDARVLRRARMLPNDPLTPDQIRQIARDAKSWLRESRRSQGWLAKRLGISDAAISGFLKDTYNGDKEKIARAVNEEIERDTRAAELPNPDGFVETEVAKHILLGVIRTAVDACGMGVVTGPSGTGKTMCMEAAAKKLPGAIYIRVLQSTRGVGIIKPIARHLGITYTKAIDCERLVIDELSGTGRPILIDEAQELNEQGLKVIRDIHDTTGCPVILCGTHDVKRKVDDSQMWYGQMASRIIARYDIAESATNPKNPRPMFTVDEVMEIFGSGKLRLTDDGAGFLTELACIPGVGALRLIGQIVRVASRLSQLRDKPVGAAELRAVVREMHGSVWMDLVKERAETLRLAKVG